MSHHFEWIEIGPQQFAGGVMNVGDWMAPPDSAAELLNYYPVPGVGLRAWAAFVEFSKAGLDFPDSEIAFGFFVRGGIPKRSGAPGEASDLYLVTYRSADKTPRLYRWDKTNDTAPPAAWTKIKTFTAATVDSPPGLATFTPYVVAGVTHVYFVLTYVGVDMGLWRIKYSDGSVTQVTSHLNPRALVTHQDRMLYGTSDQNGSRLVWNDPNTETFGAGSYIDVLPYYVGTSNVWMHSYVGDLLLAKQGAAMALVQGEIGDPVVRIMQGAKPSISSQATAETQDGIAFQVPREGVFVTQTGAESALLSDQLDPQQVTPENGLAGDVSAGMLLSAGPFLLTPSGYIFDRRTRSWFRTNAWGAGGANLEGKYMAYDSHPDQQTAYVVTRSAGFHILSAPFAEGRFTRHRAGRWRSPSIRHQSGRQILIREVQVALKGYRANSNMTITVGNRTMTVGAGAGTTEARPITGIPAVRQLVSGQFLSIGEILDVQIDTDSGADGFEAPSIEAVRIGVQPGHLVT